jgi:hypothetical protein
MGDDLDGGSVVIELPGAAVFHHFDEQPNSLDLISRTARGGQACINGSLLHHYINIPAASQPPNYIMAMMRAEEFRISISLARLAKPRIPGPWNRHLKVHSTGVV